MNLSRRRFFGLLAAPAIVRVTSLMAVVPLLLDVPPRLWGDGVHDDTAALQWCLDRMRSASCFRPEITSYPPRLIQS